MAKVVTEMSGQENMKFIYWHVEITRWVDGDTFNALMDLGMDVLRKAQFRCANHDTPERGDMFYNEATDYARLLTSDGIDHIQTFKDKTGKYGRFIATITLKDGRELSAVMIDKGLARQYSGGKRDPWPKRDP